jgi:AcrR family transcriptional regulator
MARQSYHHGDLRRAFLDAAVEVIGESGPGAMSLRELARRAGVSHAASQHHFGDRAGLLTAVACQGYELLADALGRAGGELLDVGVAYVEFAVSHRAHFEVMFQPGLYHADAPEVRAARERAGRALAGGLARMPARRGPASPHAPVAAWSIVHGFATLWLAGALPEGLGEDPGAAARPVIELLFDRGDRNGSGGGDGGG